MIRNVIIIALALVALIGGLVLVKGSQFKAMEAAGAAAGQPPESVATAEVEEAVWQLELKSIGSVEPVRGIVLRAEENGIISSIGEAFENGKRVAAGTVLVRQDTENEEARLRSAQARINSAEARLTLAEQEQRRAEQLYASKAIPEAQRDTAVAEADRARADLESARADLTEIEAIIDNKVIRAPFEGVVGIRRVNEGDYVSAGDEIVALQANETVYVNFTLPQQNLSKVSEGLEVILETSSFPDSGFRGTITAISPLVDQRTRAFELQATVDNPEGLLRVGLFVRVRVQLPTSEPVRYVPATAIAAAPYGDSVYVIQRPEEGAGEDAPLTVEQRFIRTGKRQGDFVSITEGLEPGDEIVSAGVFKLSNGASVTINNDIQPDAESDPRPPNT